MEIHHPILVATDLSARSDRAVDRALLLADSAKARLIVCHAVESGSQFADDPARAATAVQAVLPATTADVEIVIKEGSAPDVVIEEAIHNDCRLIITGVARRNQLGDCFVGTAVDRIIREAEAPVLVVKQRPRSGYRMLMVATDFSSCSRHALAAAASLFPTAVIHLVHAFHVPFEGFLSVEQNEAAFEAEAQEEFDKFLADAAIPPSLRERLTTHLRYGETQAVVQNIAQELAADLVVLGTHGRSGFSKAVFGSMAESVLRCVMPDTMVIREPTGA
jgi:nucleotide-binding universal stress UspA family protein